VEERNTCGCPLGDRYFELTVVGDSVVRVMNPEDSSLVTGVNLDLFCSVDDIFALLHSIDPADVASMSLSFDSRYGFPKDVYVDPRAGVTGDEFGYALRNFRINE
jgi:hypothetical protein